MPSECVGELLNGAWSFLGSVLGPVRGNVLLRRKQYRWADDPGKSLGIAQLCIAGKIADCRSVLQRAVRDHGNEGNMSELNQTIKLLDIRQKQALKASNTVTLRGIEGDSANAYFGVQSFDC